MPHTDPRILFAAVFASGLAACLHDTDVPLRNMPPTFAGSGIIDSLLFPDSLVGVFAVRDSNGDAARIIPGSWPGGQSWSEKGDSVSLFLHGQDLGTFEGKFALADRRNAVDSVPFRVTRRLQAFPEVSGLVSWRHFRVPDTTRFNWFEEEGVDRYGFELHYDPDTDGKSYADGLAGTFGISGDFRIRTYTYMMGDPRQDINLDFSLSPFTDSNYLPSERIGLIVRNDSGGNTLAMAYAFGKEGKTIPVMSDTTYASVIEREGEWYRILTADSIRAAADDWDTLLALREPEDAPLRETLHPHFRMAVNGGRVHVYGYFFGLSAVRGVIRP